MSKRVAFARGLTPAQLESRAHQELVRMQVKQICCGCGVATFMLPAYYCFAFEVDRVKEMDLGGDEAAIEADMAMSKWLARGLEQRVLEAIRSQVFNIEAPTP